MTHRLLLNSRNLTFVRQSMNCHNKSIDPKTNSSSCDTSKTPKKPAAFDFPEEPTTCCMSGCANCVWLDYAEKLSAIYRDGGDQAQKEILDRVSDTNMRAFLLHELRMRNKQ